MIRYSNPTTFLLLLTAIVFSRPSTAQTAEPLPGGKIVEHIVTEHDTAQSYAMYLPSSYDAVRQWPILFAMDPRGRALIPLRLFQDAAERLGYIIVSSYNTMSDIPNRSDVNEVAMEAMLTDVQRRLSLDTDRLYLAGFSGTARIAWDFARRLPDNVAGIIGFGAGFPFPSTTIQMLWDTSLVFYGGSGVLDFNYEEVRSLDQRLTDFGFPHRVEFYPGPHSWPNAALATDALEWMEVRAMRRGLAPRDPQWLAEFAREQSLRARAAADSGNLYEALRQYRSLVADLDGLANVSDAHSQIETLDRERSVRRERDRRDDLAKAATKYEENLVRFLSSVRSDRNLPSHNRAIDNLDIEDLLDRVAEDGDLLEIQAAQRMLEVAFVQLSFYEPRFHFEQQNPAKALALLRLAQAIKPLRGDVCFNIARAHSLLDQPEEAFTALDCAVDNGWRNIDAIRTHPDLEPLRALPAYQELLKRTV